MNYNVSHPSKIVECEIDLPASKSISNRLLIIKALCKKPFSIKNLSKAEDTQVLSNALSLKQKIINVGAAGTSFRFLTSYLSTLAGKEFILTGSDRMKERPIKGLVDALIKLGANIEYLEKTGFPPLKITGRNLIGSMIEIDSSISSQFISSILLISPTIKEGITLTYSKKIVSKSYIEMTLNLMGEFGISYKWEKNMIKIAPQKYIERNYVVEADWSAASFWYEIAALSKNCKIRLNGLNKNSIQKDNLIADLFKGLALKSIFGNKTVLIKKDNLFYFPGKINLINNPDLYQPLKCTLFALNKTCEITGVSTLKNKESDRIKSIKEELLKISCNKYQLNTYQDHRMAMSLAPLCLRYGSLQINNVNVVRKSYPEFWEDLTKGGFKINPSIH